MVKLEVIDAFKRLVGTTGSRIQSQYGMSGDWCAMTIWCGFQNAGAGAYLLDGAKSAWVPSYYDFYKSRGLIHDSPTPGDLVFYDWEPNGTPNHIEFFIDGTADNFTTVAGNSGSDTVVYKVRTNSGVMGFASPEYEKEGEDDMGNFSFIFQKNDENVLYFYDGGTIHKLTHPDEVTAITDAYKTVTGKDMVMYKMGTNDAPWATRFIEAIKRGD